MAQESYQPRPWIHDVRTWVGAVVLIFTLGGTFALFQDAKAAQQALLVENTKVLEAHRVITEALVIQTRAAADSTQQLLVEIVRINKVVCLNTSRDENSRRTCLGAER